MSYYNGSEWSFEWSNGRQLTHAEKLAEDATVISQIDYAYDMNGLRTSKTVDGVTHTYIYAGGKLIRETYGDTVMDFLYDASGRPYAFYHNGTLYYYVLNLQGDVVRIINENGSTKCTYRYDAWGRIISGPSSGVGVDNPLRYRGYYYDSETSFYYLQSRYYDPAICRFINADAFASTGQGTLGYNMFAYCNNNPINYEDFSGCSLYPTTKAIDDGGPGYSQFPPIPVPAPIGFDVLAEAISSAANWIEEKIDGLRGSIVKSFAHAKNANYRSPKEIHHIVAQNAIKAAPARIILEAVVPGGVENPLNLVGVKTGLHRRLHRNLYYDIVNCAIVTSYLAAATDLQAAKRNVTAALVSLNVMITALDQISPF